jgi:hypothetical protein
MDVSLLVPHVVVALDRNFSISAGDWVNFQDIHTVIKEWQSNSEKRIVIKHCQPSQIGQISVRDR